MLDVIDDGVGIDPSKIHQIFDIMHSDASNSNHDGIGLGMGIVL
jgi:K+-sensing histidine kinase KdpD